MSQWTHVSGLVRIDALPGIISGRDIYFELEQKLGNTAFFEDSPEVWEKCTVPCGSEGSLNYTINVASDEYSACWGNVSIWGDLRDYSDYLEIYKWISKFCTSENYYVRSCSVKVDVQSNSYIIYDTRGDGEDTRIVSQILAK